MHVDKQTNKHNRKPIYTRNREATRLMPIKKDRISTRNQAPLRTWISVPRVRVFITSSCSCHLLVPLVCCFGGRIECPADRPSSVPYLSSFEIDFSFLLSLSLFWFWLRFWLLGRLWLPSWCEGGLYLKKKSLK
jgi:hypothetical protein